MEETNWNTIKARITRYYKQEYESEAWGIRFQGFLQRPSCHKNKQTP